METRPMNPIAEKALKNTHKVTKLLLKMLKITNKHRTSEVLFVISHVAAQRLHLLEQESGINLDDFEEVFMETFKDLLDESLEKWISIENEEQTVQ